ncbi:MAG: hypothetical protein BECKG1743D_GA0114223_102411 [Candidatus Kentron sp. G]|nr:MAG: hypothetical protein BECKG1743E_GA0114224_102322 [Candidatus Kentron sp. G]VFN01001.1 MAG: hypothetical protein BECKG1743D_GA0114223_102411 [Candidatus Kentron sp. G]
MVEESFFSFREFRGRSFYYFSCLFVLLSVVFLFFVHAFHATISIRCWFAIDIAIRYRYRSCPAFPIASSDNDPEKTTTPVAARRAGPSVDKNPWASFF